MSSFLLLALCCAGDVAEPAPLKVLHHTNSLYWVQVEVDAGPTNARGLQIVTVRLKMNVKYAETVHDLKLDLSTRDPRSKVHVIYPKAVKVTDGNPYYYVHEGEFALQAIVERAPGDQSPVQGQVDFRVRIAGV